jgi:hypothetical protein
MPALRGRVAYFPDRFRSTAKRNQKKDAARKTVLKCSALIFPRKNKTGTAAQDRRLRTARRPKTSLILIVPSP